MSYRFLGYRESDLARLDVLVAGDLIAPFSRIIPKVRMETEAKEMALRLKKLIPKQNFQVAIQVCFGGRVLAREDISAFRKDVIAKLYGGDRTRKDKLLKKQAKGKKRMKRFGKVDIPSGVFLKMLEK
jgi:GTP-binding protein LepA